MEQQVEYNAVRKGSAEPAAVGVRIPWARDVWLAVIGVTAFAGTEVYCAAVQPRQGQSPAILEKGPGESTSTPPEPLPLPPEPTPGPLGFAYVPPATADGLEKEAFGVCGQLMKDFPNRTDPIGLMGMVHHQLGDAAAAVKCWEECLRRNPRRADVYQAMSQLSLGQEDYQRAETLARKALELGPRLPGTHNFLAQALMGLGRPKEAVAVLEEQLRSSPERSRNEWLDQDYFLAGKAYQQLTEFAQAKQRYQKAIEIQPHYTEAYYALATVCARLGEGDKAKQYMEKFKTLKAEGLSDHLDRRSRGSDEAWLRRVLAHTHAHAGQIYRGHGKLREAEEHWQKAAILDPENLVCRMELATLYAKSGRNNEALELCQHLIRMDPKNALCHFNMGVLYARMNQIGSALVALRRAMELEPGNAQYQRVYRHIREMK